MCVNVQWERANLQWKCTTDVQKYKGTVQSTIEMQMIPIVQIDKDVCGI